MTSQPLTRKSPTTVAQMRRRFEAMAAEHVARLGSRIAGRRRELGLTQKQLADQLPGNADSNQVSKWERGAHKPSDDTLEHIARVLQTTVTDLLLDPHVAPDIGALAGASGTGIGPTDLQRVEAKIDALLAYFNVEVSLPGAGRPFGAVLAHAQSQPGEQTPATSPAGQPTVDRRTTPTRRRA